MMRARTIVFPTTLLSAPPRREQPLEHQPETSAVADETPGLSTPHNLEEAIAACTTNADDDFFEGGETLRTKALGDAYWLLSFLGSDGDLEKVLAAPYLRNRKHQVPRSNRAYVVTLLRLKPRSKAHRKRASDWAMLLAWAQREAIQPEEFERFAAGKTLAQIKAALRGKSGVMPTMRLPIDPSLYPLLQAALKASNSDTTTRSRVLDELTEVFGRIESSLAETT